MGTYRKRNLYHETTDSRTFSILHITTETGCCLRCAKRQRRGWYGSFNVYKKELKWPSWKLVSKNKKQWMKKSLKYKYKPLRNNYYEGKNWLCCELTW
jgi:hypothetical protein